MDDLQYLADASEFYLSLKQANAGFKPPSPPSVAGGLAAGGMRTPKVPTSTPPVAPSVKTAAGPLAALAASAGVGAVGGAGTQRLGLKARKNNAQKKIDEIKGRLSITGMEPSKQDIRDLNEAELTLKGVDWAEKNPLKALATAALAGATLTAGAAGAGMGGEKLYETLLKRAR